MCAPTTVRRGATARPNTGMSGLGGGCPETGDLGRNCHELAPWGSRMHWARRDRGPGRLRQSWLMRATATASYRGPPTIARRNLAPRWVSVSRLASLPNARLARQERMPGDTGRWVPSEGTTPAGSLVVAGCSRRRPPGDRGHAATVRSGAAPLIGVAATVRMPLRGDRPGAGCVAVEAPGDNAWAMGANSGLVAARTPDEAVAAVGRGDVGSRGSGGARRRGAGVFVHDVHRRQCPGRRRGGVRRDAAG